MQAKNFVMVLKLLLNIRLVWWIYENIDEFNPNKTPKTLIVFDDMIADMLTNKKPLAILTELCIWGRKISISTLLWNFQTKESFWRLLNNRNKSLLNNRNQNQLGTYFQKISKIMKFKKELNQSNRRTYW